MKQTLRACLLAITALYAPTGAGALAGEQIAIPDEPSAAAMDFVSQFSDAHLTGMLQRIGSRQPTMVALSQLHGQMLAAVYDAEIAKAVKKHGPAWQTNMARAWTLLMSDEELVSLKEDGASSPHAAKYQEMTPKAGRRMQDLSGDMFRGILAEVIQNTMAALGEDEPEEKKKE